MKTFSRFDFALILQRLVLVIFALFPITLAAIAQVLFIFRTWDALKAVQISLLVGVFIVPVILIFISPALWAMLEKHKNLLVLWVLAIAIGLRLALIPLISTDFGSDMADIHLFAADINSGNANLNNYPNISYAAYLSLTSLVLSFVYKIFGASTTVAKLFLVVLSVLTTWLVYLTGREIAGTKVGVAASLLYASLPSLICYTGVLTGDHLALPFIVLAILIQAYLQKSDQIKSYYSLIGYALCGATIGFVDWFRPFGLILLVALVVATLIYQIKRLTFFRLALALSLLVFSYFAMSRLAGVTTERVFHAKMLSIFQKIGGHLLVGLNPDSRGKVTLEDGITIGETYQRLGDDYAAINRYLIESAFDRLDGGKFQRLLIEKFDIMWSNHIELFDYALVGSNDQEIVYLMADIESLIYLAITLFILVGAIASILGGSHSAILTMQLFMLGFGMLMLVMEAQNRYSVVVMPYLILLGVIGLKDAFSLKARFTLPQD